MEGETLMNKASRRTYPTKDSIPILFNETDLGPQNLKIQKMYQWMAAGFDIADRIGNLLSLDGITKMRRQLASGLGLKPGEHTKICRTISIFGIGFPQASAMPSIRRSRKEECIF
jgi:hypothetical protein